MGKSKKVPIDQVVVDMEPTLEDVVKSGLVNIYFDDEWKELYVLVNVAGYGVPILSYHPEKRYIRINALPLAEVGREVARGFAKDPINLVIPLGSDSSVPYASLDGGILQIKSTCPFRDSPRDEKGYISIELDMY